MRKKIFSLLIVLSLVVILSSGVLAFFPISHKYTFEKTLPYKSDSNIKKAVDAYPDLAYAGSELVDVSVSFYYTYFKRYEITHSPSFCRDLIAKANNQEELACASGCGIHYGSDIVSHNEMVEYCIEHSGLPNSMAHVLCEQKLDNYIESKDPGIKGDVIASMNSYSKCVPLFKRVLQENMDYQGVNLDSLFSKFVAEIQGSKTGYDPAFNNLVAIPLVIMAIFVFFWILLLLLIVLMVFRKEKSWINWATIAVLIPIFLLMSAIFIGNIGGKAFATTQLLVFKPLSKFMPIGNPEYYIDKSIANINNFYANGEKVFFGTEPSGATLLKKADNDVALRGYVILGVLVAVIAVIIFFNFKRFGKKHKK